MIYILIFFIVILLFITFSSLKFNVLNINNNTKASIKIATIFNLNIDYNKFINIFKIYTDYDDNISLRALYYNLRIMIYEKEYFKDLLNHITIDKITIISKNNSTDPIYDNYINAISIIMFSFIKELLKNNFKEVKEESYLIDNKNKNDDKYDFDYTLQFKIKIYDIIKYSLINYKKVYFLVKNIKEIK